MRRPVAHKTTLANRNHNNNNQAGVISSRRRRSSKFRGQLVTKDENSGRHSSSNSRLSNNRGDLNEKGLVFRDDTFWVLKCWLKRLVQD